MQVHQLRDDFVIPRLWITREDAGRVQRYSWRGSSSINAQLESACVESELFMSSLSISLIVFACVFGAALLGVFVHFRLPEHHLASDTKDVVRLAMGLVATTVALALGLLIGSAKSFFDTQNNEIAQLAANTVLLDRLLAAYGPEASDARHALRIVVSNFNHLTLGEGGGAQSSRALAEAIQVLSPQTDNQHFVKNQAMGLAIQLAQTRWMMIEQRTVPIPVILLGVLVFWLTALFLSFGMFAKPNATLIAGLLVSAFAVSAAIFLILEMYHPYTGLIQVSSEPIRAAMTQLGQ